VAAAGLNLSPGQPNAAMSGNGDGVATLAAQVNWAAPWLAPYQSHGRGLENQTQSPVAAGLNALAEPDTPVHFTAAAELPEGEAYEAFIARTGRCPTRDNLHDLFNGLVWLRFPQTKRQLNRLQAEQIRSAGVRATRGSVRDALTVFDENAAFLLAPAPLWDALLARDWHTLFVSLRPAWQEAQLVLFGHALLEKLVHPRKAITAHVYRLPPNGVCMLKQDLCELDSRMAQGLEAKWLATKPFAPLPVLGVPGWCADNQNFSFYDDSVVFRRPAARPGNTASKIDLPGA
jgi:Protein of unknown function (DUF3025)